MLWGQHVDLPSSIQTLVFWAWWIYLHTFSMPSAFRRPAVYFMRPEFLRGFSLRFPATPTVFGSYFLALMKAWSAVEGFLLVLFFCPQTEAYSSHVHGKDSYEAVDHWLWIHSERGPGDLHHSGPMWSLKFCGQSSVFSLPSLVVGFSSFCLSCHQC